MALVYDQHKAYISRNGIDFANSPVPDEMANANHGGREYHPTIAVGDHSVLVLEKFHDEVAGKTELVALARHAAAVIDRSLPAPLA